MIPFQRVRGIWRSETERVSLGRVIVSSTGLTGLSRVEVTERVSENSDTSDTKVGSIGFTELTRDRLWKRLPESYHLKRERALRTGWNERRDSQERKLRPHYAVSECSCETKTVFSESEGYHTDERKTKRPAFHRGFAVIKKRLGPGISSSMRS